MAFLSYSVFCKTKEKEKQTVFCKFFTVEVNRIHLKRGIWSKNTLKCFVVWNFKQRCEINMCYRLTSDDVCQVPTVSLTGNISLYLFIYFFISDVKDIHFKQRWKSYSVLQENTFTTQQNNYSRVPKFWLAANRKTEQCRQVQHLLYFKSILGPNIIFTLHNELAFYLKCFLTHSVVKLYFDSEAK